MFTCTLISFCISLFIQSATINLSVFHRAFKEWCFAQHELDILQGKKWTDCPSCFGLQHSCHVDGNAKLYRYNCRPRCCVFLNTDIFLKIQMQKKFLASLIISVLYLEVKGNVIMIMSSLKIMAQWKSTRTKFILINQPRYSMIMCEQQCYFNFK